MSEYSNISVSNTLVSIDSNTVSTAEEFKTINLLPEVFNSDKLKNFFDGTVEQVFSKPQSVKTTEYIGRKYGSYYQPLKDNYKTENTKNRTDYQLETASVIKNASSQETEDVIFYNELLDFVSTENGYVNNQARLFAEDFYSYGPPIDHDKFLNYENYYWYPSLDGNFVPIEIKGSVENITASSGGQTEFELSYPYNANVDKVTLNGVATTAFTAIGKTITLNSGTTVGDILQVIHRIDPDEILGQKNYTSPNGIVLSSGMMISFESTYYTTSSSYIANTRYYVEDVGTETGIRLVETSETAALFLGDTQLEWDRADTVGSTDLIKGWDAERWDTIPDIATPDYITIERGSRDKNPWSSTNGWVHKNNVPIYRPKEVYTDSFIPWDDRIGWDISDTVWDANVLTSYVNVAFQVDNARKGRRPIIEFNKDIELYNYGINHIATVDLLSTEDNTTQIQSQSTYTIDGVPLENNHTILFVNPGFNTSLVPWDGGNNPWDHDIDNDPNTPVEDDGDITTTSGLTGGDLGWDVTGSDFDVSSSLWQADNVGANQIQITLNGAVTVDIDAGVTIEQLNSGATGVLAESLTANSSTLMKLTDVTGTFTTNASDTLSVQSPATAIGLYPTVTNANIVLTKVSTVVKDQDKVTVRLGENSGGKEFHWNGYSWILSQTKSGVNIPPLFNLYDYNGYALTNTIEYPSSDFNGNKLFGYTVGTGTNDNILNFAVDYDRFAGIGEINFKNYMSDLNSTYGSTFYKQYTHPVVLQKTFDKKILVQRSASQNRFYVDSIERQNIVVIKGNKYIFDLNDSSLVSTGYTGTMHPFALSTTEDGSHNSGSVYSTNVKYFLDDVEVEASDFLNNSTFDSATKRKIEFTPDNSSPTELYYYCPNHSGMGGKIFLENNSITQLIDASTKEYLNLWVPSNTKSKQKISQEFEVTEQTSANTFVLETVIADDSKVRLYVNSLEKNRNTDYTISSNQKIVMTNNLTVGSHVVVTWDTYENKNLKSAYYTPPKNLSHNPENNEIISHSYSDLLDHFGGHISNQTNFSGLPLGNNTYKDTKKDLTKGDFILQHASPLLKFSAHVNSPDRDLIKAIRFGQESYARFKNKFLNKVQETVDKVDTSSWTDSQLVDYVLKDINKNKKVSDNWSYSLMASYGDTKQTESITITTANKTWSNNAQVTQQVQNYQSIHNTIGASGLDINFAFNPKDDKDIKSLYVYNNNSLLMMNHDYVIDNVVGTRIVWLGSTKPDIGDVITLEYYDDKQPAWIPATPSKLGMAKVYLPQQISDNSYSSGSVTFTQGHDGSLIPLYNDDRDRALLELEKRIFNDIENRFIDPDYLPPLSYDNLVSNYFNSKAYSYKEFNRIIRSHIYRWATFNEVDYVSNQNYDSSDWKTWNWSEVFDLTGDNAPGHWRGIYKKFYGTDRPHTHPWEMLGFSIKPRWWDNNYSWTNTAKRSLMISDIEKGIIRDGDRANFVNSKYADRNNFYRHEDFSDYVPVDTSGNLINPYNIGPTGKTLVTKEPNNTQRQKSWNIGDMAPGERAFYMNSISSFALITTYSLMRPAEFYSLMFDTLNLTPVPVNENIYFDNVTKLRHTNNVYVHREKVNNQIVAGTGYNQYVSERIIQRNKDVSLAYGGVIRNTRPQLAHKQGAFIDFDSYKVQSESYSPDTQSSSIFIPNENINQLIHVSPAIKNFTYSGVIIEKTISGYSISGYDAQKNYFTTTVSEKNGPSHSVRVGGETIVVPTFIPSQTLKVGQYVKYESVIYTVIREHVTTNEFVASNFRSVNQVPVEGGKAATYYRSIKRNKTVDYEYGTTFKTEQEVFDFLVNYGRYLESQGWRFDDYNSNTNQTNDWLYSAKEFLFWCLGNWELGSLLALSPSANKIKFYPAQGIVANVEDIVGSTYSILNKSGRAIEANTTTVIRKDNGVEITQDQLEPIYFVNLYTREIEHVTVFDNRTQFNDVIYDPTLSIRQPRLKQTVLKTTNWTGKLSTQGYLVSTANGIISNFETSTQDVLKYLDIDSPISNDELKKAGLRTIGFSNREYLENLQIIDENQAKFYQGFVKQKGTVNAIDRITRSDVVSGNQSIGVYEYYAFKMGEYGGTEVNESIEFKIDGNKVKTNPQLFHFVSSVDGIITEDITTDDVITIDADDTVNWIKKPSGDKNNTQLWSTRSEQFELPTAGYVHSNDVTYKVFERKDLEQHYQNNSNIASGSTYWIAKDTNLDWNAYRLSVIDQSIDSIVAINPLQVTLDETSGKLLTANADTQEVVIPRHQNNSANVITMTHGSKLLELSLTDQAVTKTINFADFSGSNADVIADTLLDQVKSIVISDGGSSYSANDTIDISGSGGTGASGLVNSVKSEITQIQITNSGSDYTTSSSINTTTPTGDSVQIGTVSSVHNEIDTVTITSGGGGYQVGQHIVTSNWDGNSANANVVWFVLGTVDTVDGVTGEILTLNTSTINIGSVPIGNVVPNTIVLDSTLTTLVSGSPTASITTAGTQGIIDSVTVTTPNNIGDQLIAHAQSNVTISDGSAGTVTISGKEGVIDSVSVTGGGGGFYAEPTDISIKTGSTDSAGSGAVLRIQGNNVVYSFTNPSNVSYVAGDVLTSNIVLLQITDAGQNFQVGQKITIEKPNNSSETFDFASVSSVFNEIQNLRLVGGSGTGYLASDTIVLGDFVIGATSIQNGNQYRILTVGTTDFTTVGSANNNVGTVFTASGTPTGDGTVVNLDKANVDWWHVGEVDTVNGSGGITAISNSIVNVGSYDLSNPTFTVADNVLSNVSSGNGANVYVTTSDYELGKVSGLIGETNWSIGGHAVPAGVQNPDVSSSIFDVDLASGNANAEGLRFSLSFVRTNTSQVISNRSSVVYISTSDVDMVQNEIVSGGTSLVDGQVGSISNVNNYAFGDETFGGIKAFKVNNGGNNYRLPTLTVQGTGPGLATGEVDQSSGIITSAYVINPGYGYRKEFSTNADVQIDIKDTITRSDDATLTFGDSLIKPDSISNITVVVNEDFNTSVSPEIDIDTGSNINPIISYTSIGSNVVITSFTDVTSRANTNIRLRFYGTAGSTGSATVTVNYKKATYNVKEMDSVSTEATAQDSTYMASNTHPLWQYKDVRLAARNNGIDSGNVGGSFVDTVNDFVSNVCSSVTFTEGDKIWLDDGFQGNWYTLTMTSNTDVVMSYNNMAVPLSIPSAVNIGSNYWIVHSDVDYAEPNSTVFKDTLRSNRIKKQINSHLFTRSKMVDSDDYSRETPFEIFDPVKNLIPGVAQRELSYVSESDPATYTDHSDSDRLTTSNIWGDDQVGQTWWDLSTTRYFEYENFDIQYRRDNWGRTFPNSTITIYEWTKSSQTPESYAGDGVPGNTTNYVSKTTIDRQGFETTKYYYWVKNKVTVPAVEWRSLTTTAISRLIKNPTSYGINWMAPVYTNTLMVANSTKLITDESVFRLNFKTKDTTQQVHKQWLLLGENDPNVLVDQRLWNKLTDSLSGKDASGLAVPDTSTLSELNRYGNKVRPRQTWFKNVKEARRVFAYKANEILANINLDISYPEWENGFVSSAIYDKVDYFVSGYSNSIVIDRTVDTYTDIDTSVLNKNDVIKVKLDHNSKWALYVYGDRDEILSGKAPVATTTLTTETAADVTVSSGAYGQAVIQSSSSSSSSNSSQSYDLVKIANQTSTMQLNTNFHTNDDVANDTRLLLSKMYSYLFVGERKINLNKLLFTSINFIFTEQQDIDWVIKTSYFDLVQEELSLQQQINYQPDTFNYVKDYVNEVKPYHSKLLNYLSKKTTGVEDANVSIMERPSLSYDETNGNINGLINITSTLVFDRVSKNIELLDPTLNNTVDQLTQLKSLRTTEDITKDGLSGNLSYGTSNNTAIERIAKYHFGAQLESIDLTNNDQVSAYMNMVRREIAPFKDVVMNTLAFRFDEMVNDESLEDLGIDIIGYDDILMPWDSETKQRAVTTFFSSAKDWEANLNYSTTVSVDDQGTMSNVSLVKHSGLSHFDAWSTSSAYEVGDLVTYDGQLYACNVKHNAVDSGSTPYKTYTGDANTGNIIDFSKWNLIEDYVYLAQQTHTSTSNFVTDYGSGKWQLVTRKYDGAGFVRPQQRDIPEELIPTSAKETLRITVVTYEYVDVDTSDIDADGDTTEQHGYGDQYTFRIFYDNNGASDYKRLPLSFETTLTANVTAQSREIEVTDATVLYDTVNVPNPDNNSVTLETVEGFTVSDVNPGYVWIGTELIEFREVSGNKLRKIRRGVKGTTIQDHTTGDKVNSASSQHTIPNASQSAYWSAQDTAGTNLATDPTLDTTDQAVFIRLGGNSNFNLYDTTYAKPNYVVDQEDYFGEE